jgi:hypothetical protein
MSQTRTSRSDRVVRVVFDLDINKSFPLLYLTTMSGLTGLNAQIGSVETGNDICPGYGLLPVKPLPPEIIDIYMFNMDNLDIPKRSKGLRLSGSKCDLDKADRKPRPQFDPPRRLPVPLWRQAREATR